MVESVTSATNQNENRERNRSSRSDNGQGNSAQPNGNTHRPRSSLARCRHFFALSRFAPNRLRSRGVEAKGLSSLEGGIPHYRPAMLGKRAARGKNARLNDREIQRMCPSQVADGDERGYIVPIGGAEEKEHDPRILKRFVRLCGGKRANIVVIPTASRMEDTGRRYEHYFAELGVARVEALYFIERKDGSREDWLEKLTRATGVFFTGGDQLRLSTILGGTPAAKLIRQANAAGVTVGGTSAGASILSEHMIAFGSEGGSPRAGSVRLAPGLGLTNRFIIDQHFRQRDRLGRLVSALAYNPFSVGIGLDEDTAAFIGPDNTLEVEGSGAVTVVDADGAEFSSMAQAGEDDPVCILGLKIHILVRGATFNLHTRKASAGSLASG